MSHLKSTRNPTTAQTNVEAGPALLFPRPEQIHQLKQSRHLAGEPTAEQVAAQEAQAAQEAAIVEKAAAAVEAKLGKQLNGLSAAQRNFEKSFKEWTEKVKPPEPANPDGTEAKLDAIRKELATERETTAAERRAAETEKREASIQTAIASHKIDSNKADFLFDHVQQRYTKDLKIEGGKLYHTDPVTLDKKPIEDFIGDILKGPKGDMFKTAPGAGADTKGLGRKTTTAGQRVPVSEMSNAEVDKLNKENPDLLRAMVKEDLGR